MRRWQLQIGLGVIALIGALAQTSAWAQRVAIQASRQPYEGVPFAVAVVAEGFDESPEPAAPTLQVPGCDVQFVDVQRSISTSISIIHGRRSQTHRVTFVFQYEVTAERAGQYQILPVTVRQGRRAASSPATAIRVERVATTSDLRIAVNLPGRPVWVGETFAVSIDWFLRSEVQSPNLVIPLLTTDALDIDIPEPDPEQPQLAIEASGRTLRLPYEQTRAAMGGVPYERLRFPVTARATRPGRIEIAPAQVVALVRTGIGRDPFGFASPRWSRLKATDVARALEVRALPTAGRPASFANAVGRSFSLAVQASRTVVAVGEPVELDILLRGDANLEGVSLPPLARGAGLDPFRFAIVDETAAGTLLPDGQGKRFRATVQVKRPDVSAIPALRFSYFDPAAGDYKTVESEPIALAVTEGALVGARDVVGARAAPSRSPPRSPAPPESMTGAAGRGEADALDTTGADLLLSDAAKTMAPVASTADVRPYWIVLYAAGLLILLARLWQVQTRARRGARSALRAAFADLERAAAAAEGQPAREAAAGLVAALRAVRRRLGGQPQGYSSLLERIETAGFAPAAASHPLPGELLAEVRQAAHRWVQGTRREKVPRAVVENSLLLLIASAGLHGLAGPRAAAAPEASPESRLHAAREAYYRGLETGEDADGRRAHFARAERLFAELAAEYPNRPDLVADWGSAALAAGELGPAILAYRRVLWADPGHTRARQNLRWTRSHNPEWLPTPRHGGAVDSLFFWHSRTSRAERHVIAAACFALTLLLVALFCAGSRRRFGRWLALVPAAVWLAMALSLLLERDQSRDAVVMADAVTLRAADSAGAPAAFRRPLPAGSELVVAEARGGWARVVLADGTAGWLRESALAYVVLRQAVPPAVVVSD